MAASDKLLGVPRHNWIMGRIFHAWLTVGLFLQPGTGVAADSGLAEASAKKSVPSGVRQGTASFDARYWVPARPPSAHYQIEARLGLEGVEGKETITLINTASRPLIVLALDWTTSEARSITVKADGKALTILNPSRTPSGATSSPLLYALPRPVAPKAKVRLVVDFQAGDIACPPLHEIKMKSWYPRLWWDGLAACDSFEVKLVTPPDYALAVSARFNPKTGCFENKGVATCGVYLGKGMRVKEREVEGVLIRAIFTEQGAECARLCLETAADAVRFYKRWLGFYPYRFLTLVPGEGTPQGGYPFATGIVAIHGEEQFEQKPRSHWQWITAHEIGHQYWGEYVMDADSPAWLWIGLGIYADHEYLRARGAFGPGCSQFITGYVDALRKGLDTTMDLPPAHVGKVAFDFNNVVIHDKGFSVISALESTLGKETFERAYRRCLRDYGKRRMGYRDFWRVAEEESGQNLGWFFEQWVRSSDHACYQVVLRECGESPTGSERYLSRIAVEAVGSLRLPVPVKAVFEDGTAQVKFTDRLARVSYLEFESHARLKEVALDPECKLAMLREPRMSGIEELEQTIEQWKGPGPAEQAIELFQAAQRLKCSRPETWFVLAMTLLNGGYLDETLEALRQAGSDGVEAHVRFAAFVWMGHVHDLKGERVQAIKAYQEALRCYPGTPFSMDSFKCRLDRRWVEWRLQTPYATGDALKYYVEALKTGYRRGSADGTGVKIQQP
jgi:tetratricopeptide (TPR) repeat protein